MSLKVLFFTAVREVIFLSVPYARKLRKSMTDAELKLWSAIRCRSLGVKFRRQVPIGPYIVDFACLDPLLIIEVDGGQHANCSKDVARDAILQDQGFKVLRFWNNEVLCNLDGVLTRILLELEALLD